MQRMQRIAIDFTNGTVIAIEAAVAHREGLTSKCTPLVAILGLSSMGMKQIHPASLFGTSSGS
jgi:hypothetical protein